ncbi:MAG: sulfatase-like hydrolase/transferase, partial [Acidobacteriota bacterium]
MQIRRLEEVIVAGGKRQRECEENEKQTHGFFYFAPPRLNLKLRNNVPARFSDCNGGADNAHAGPDQRQAQCHLASRRPASGASHWRQWRPECEYAGGVNFTAAVSGMPLCCPFRGSLLTGKYPHECVPGHEYPLPKGQPTITTPLREAGYTTAWFGKWHLGGFHERDGRAAKFIVPPDLRGGFDKWVGYENNNSQWDCWVHGGQGQELVVVNAVDDVELQQLWVHVVLMQVRQIQHHLAQPEVAVQRGQAFAGLGHQGAVDGLWHFIGRQRRGHGAGVLAQLG